MIHSRLLFPALLLQTASMAQWETLPDVPIELVFPVVVEFEGALHVIGGGAPAGAYDIHLRYTPSTNQWDTLAHVPYRAQQPCGAVVDGRIHYCGGGYPNTGTPVDDHYYYDGALDEWFEAAPLPFPTAINEAAEMDGRLYVMSGQPDRWLCQYYDPATDEWTQVDDLPDMNFWYGAIISARGTIYRFAGGGYTAPNEFAHVYDGPNDDWLSLTGPPSALHAPAGANMGDSLLCIAGGYFNGATDAVWLYDIDGQTYTPSEPLPSARSYHALVNVSGCLYSVGGNGADEQIGVSLLRNCSPSLLTGIPPTGADVLRPYSILSTSGALEIRFNEPPADVAIEVLDAAGKRISAGQVPAGTSVHRIDGSALDSGAYLVVIRIGALAFSEKWIVP